MAKESLKLIGILTTTFLVSSAFTIISPFYPAVAIRQGIPQWMIGLIFSIFPLSSLIFSFFIADLFHIISHKSVLLIGLSLIALGNITLGHLECCSRELAIFVSFFSRILAGAGSACANISSNSILFSDFPNKIIQIMALAELIGGLGFIFGPILGSLFFSYGGFGATCIIIGIVLLMWTSILFLLLGKSSTSETSSNEVNMTEIIKKPKLLIAALMPLVMMFSIGVNLPSLELHLISYGVAEKDIGFWFGVYTVGYMVSSVVMMNDIKEKKAKVMNAGVLIMAIGFFLLGPAPVLFERNFWLACIGLHFIGWAVCIIYIPCIPCMIELARNVYRFKSDEKLNDAISGIVNISLCVGEIAGPIVGSYLPEFMELEDVYMAVSFAIFGYFCISVATFFNKGQSSEQSLETSLYSTDYDI